MIKMHIIGTSQIDGEEIYYGYFNITGKRMEEYANKHFNDLVRQQGHFVTFKKVLERV